MDNQEIIRRFQLQASDRTTVQEMWDLITEYVCPYRGEFFREQRDEHSIEWRDRSVWDATAIMAHQTLAASLHGSLTSPSTQWFDIRFRDDKLNKDKAAAAWLREASQKVYYTLQDSNFNLEINETYQDLCGFGTGFIYQEDMGTGEDWEMVFSSVPLKEAYFEEDHKGQCLRFYRHLKWTAAKIVSKFGEEGTPERIRKMDEDGNTQEIDVIFCIYPRKVAKIGMGRRVSPKRRPYGFKYITLNGGELLGKEGGYYEMPVHIPRWRKTSESQWGNSPAMYAMNDILTLNAWIEIITIAAEKQIDPPMIAEEHALITDLNLDARKLTVVRNIEGLKPLQTGADFTVSMEGIERLQSNIRNYFFNDQLNFPQPQAQPMTATEAQIRYELMQRLLGPTLGRIRSDMLDRIIARTFNMLARANQLPEVPAILQEAENTDMDMEYTGALARAQRVDQAAAVERWLAIVGQAAATLGPEVGMAFLDVPSGEDISRGLGRYLNVDPMFMNDEMEIKRKQEDRQRKADAMQAMAGAQMEGEAAEAQGKGAQAMEEAGQTVTPPRG